MLKINQIETFKNSVEDCENINLIIGPNNSGKTVFLKEIYSCVDNISVSKDSKWINKVQIKSKNLKDVIKTLIPKVYDVDNFEMVRTLSDAGYKSFSTRSDIWNQPVFNESRQLPEGGAECEITKTLNQDSKWYFWRFVSDNLIALEDCGPRLGGPFNTTINNLLTEQQGNILNYLSLNKDILEEIKRNIREVFNIDIGFDNLQQGQKPLRVLPKEKIKGETNSREVALKWQKESPLIETQGDGIKAYLKLVFSLLQPLKTIIFIDEPETFLHPPQRRALGTLVAKLVKERGKQLFIATHDPEFLRGILSFDVSNIKIFYLKRKENIFDYTVFSAKDIATLTQSKSNLYTERVLNSFFYVKTILCEDENDRVFYEGASALYLWNLFQDVNFIGLNGRGEALKIFQKLHEFDLDVGVLVDIDFILDESFPLYISDTALKDKFEEFKRTFQSLEQRNIITREEFKESGIQAIEKRAPQATTNLKEILDGLFNYNIFIVPIGELESWTRDDLGRRWSLQGSLNLVYSKTKRKLKKFLERILTKQ